MFSTRLIKYAIKTSSIKFQLIAIEIEIDSE